jgi:tripartite-type tricarboxylate transporter receptor subunit TctC
VRFTRRLFHYHLWAPALFCAMSAWAADNYPTRPITLIVPFAPGGGNDTVARVIGQTMSGPLGQQVVVDNKPG